MLTGILSSLILQPFVNPGAYAKHWGAVGTGVAGAAAQAYGDQIGLTPTNIQITIGVLTTIAVNLFANR